MPRTFHILLIATVAVGAITGCTVTPQPTAVPPTAGPPTAAPATATPVGITLLTEPAPAEACMDALAQGTLVPDPRTGLGLATPDGGRTPVMWPFGYSARLVDGEIELVDDSGDFVAREGAVVQMGGGFGSAGLFYACARGIQVVG